MRASVSERLSSKVRIPQCMVCRWIILVPFIGTVDDWDKSFDINGKGVFLCYKYAALQMIQQGRGGRIIGASSLAGKQGKHFLYI
jgi:NAD(P)-dependent dehydrogenase (short-subunit alcohol dehydrogenase family)